MLVRRILWDVGRGLVVVELVVEPIAGPGGDGGPLPLCPPPAPGTDGGGRCGGDPLPLFPPASGVPAPPMSGIRVNVIDCRIASSSSMPRSCTMQTSFRAVWRCAWMSCMSSTRCWTSILFSRSDSCGSNITGGSAGCQPLGTLVDTHSHSSDFLNPLSGISAVTPQAIRTVVIPASPAWHDATASVDFSTSSLLS